MLLNKLFSLSFYFFVLALFSSLVPDIDSASSFLGKKLKVISTSIEFFFSHRGIFHSFTFLIIIFLVLSVFKEKVALAFFLGYSGHIFLDMLTKTGIRYFWPLDCRIQGKIKTGSITEHILFIIFLFLILLLFFY